MEADLLLLHLALPDLLEVFDGTISFQEQHLEAAAADLLLGPVEA